MHLFRPCFEHGLSNRGTGTNQAKKECLEHIKDDTDCMDDRQTQKCLREISVSKNEETSFESVWQALVQSSYHIYKCQDRIFIVIWTSNMRVLIFVFFCLFPCALRLFNDYLKLSVMDYRRMYQFYTL